jgi:hypothetical protein
MDVIKKEKDTALKEKGDEIVQAAPVAQGDVVIGVLPKETAHLRAV